MRSKYKIVRSSDKKVIRINAEDKAQTQMFFENIRAFTGLDRHMAETILNSGVPIEHPSVTFSIDEAA